jgi:hypothetical protein
MMLSAVPEHSASLMTVECGLTLIAVAVSFYWPELGSDWFSRIERWCAHVARKPRLAVAIVCMLAFLLRLAVLPLCPIPHPFAHDDFSFLLASDTFASARLTNPTPAMWAHFESFHITMIPTYMSMYFPGQGLVLALGKILTGCPWFGLLCITAMMCASICWMLQAWLPPSWALLGGIFAIFRLGLFSYWINTYSGGGSLAALGGALVLGAFPRFRRKAQLRNGSLLALGVILLFLSRPYEGLILCLLTGFVLAHWLFFSRDRPASVVLIRCAIAPLSLFIIAGGWMAYYNYCVFGSALTLPYTVNRTTYAIVPYFVWQAPRPEPVYRHEVLRSFYHQNELKPYQQIHSLSGFLPQTMIKAARGLLFFSGILLLTPLVMVRRIFLDRRIRFLVVCVLALAFGMIIETFLIPHYLAPFTAAFYAIGLQAMRHLRLWRNGVRPVGVALVRLTVILCLILSGLRLYAVPLHFKLSQWPTSGWTESWYGPNGYGGQRAEVEARLESLPRNQLTIVRYSQNHDPSDDWVYNAADIDASKVIWARDMGTAKNLELIHYYKERQVWLIQPDLHPIRISPYPVAMDKSNRLW